MGKGDLHGTTAGRTGVRPLRFFGTLPILSQVPDVGDGVVGCGDCLLCLH